MLDKEERKTGTSSAPCLAAGKFVPSVGRAVVVFFLDFKLSACSVRCMLSSE